jgi:hypothetical protein
MRPVASTEGDTAVSFELIVKAASVGGMEAAGANTPVKTCDCPAEVGAIVISVKLIEVGKRGAERDSMHSSR